jgi:hypothetical protein
MSLGIISRQKATITVTVEGKPRRFILRAHSVAEHLALLELKDWTRAQALTEALTSTPPLDPVELARAELGATLALAVHLLQEPADAGQPLTEVEAWELGSADPARVLWLQEKLTATERTLAAEFTDSPYTEIPTTGELAGRWLDVGATISNAGLAPDAQAPLSTWSLEQTVETYYRACSLLWRAAALKISLAGGDPGHEPDFRTGKANVGGVDSAPFTVEDEVRYAKMKAEIEAGFAQGNAPSYPADMGRVAKAAYADAHFNHMKTEYSKANTDPDGRKFPGTL